MEGQEGKLHGKEGVGFGPVVNWASGGGLGSLSGLCGRTTTPLCFGGSPGNQFNPAGSSGEGGQLTRRFHEAATPANPAPMTAKRATPASLPGAAARPMPATALRRDGREGGAEQVDESC